MRKSLKHAALRTMRGAGVFSLASRIRRQDTLLILCYHGISILDEHEWEGGLYITPSMFRRRLEMLGNMDAHVLPLAEGLERLRTGTLPRRSVVITFDDGFYDFYRHALPIIGDFGFPCTVYLTTYYASRCLPVYNLMLSYLLWKSGKQGVMSGPGRIREVARMVDEAERKGLTTQGKEEMVHSFAESLDVDYRSLLDARIFQIMNPDEVADAAQKGVDIQLHTHRHRTPLDRDLFIKEIDENARSIQNWTGQRANHFCYPSGVTSPQFLPWLKEAKVASATTCTHGLATINSQSLMLPRFLDASSVGDIDFESWMSGIR